MLRNGHASTYQRNQVSTVAKAKLIILMYDGAIRFVREAMDKSGPRDVSARGAAITRAQRIVGELQNSLDSARGGPVAENLQRAYVEITRNLVQANITGQAKHLATALDMLTMLREAWDQVINKSAETAPAAAPAARLAMNV